jgi:hypothetical protein
MPKNDGWFQPGQSGNPAGRVPGAINRRDREIFARLKARGDKVEPDDDPSENGPPSP